jgi:hypothetical protein
MRSPLLDRVRTDAACAGLNLVGFVDRARFDASEPRERRIANVAPQCGTVVVLGSGGHSAGPQLFAWQQLAGCAASLGVAGAERLAAMLRAEGISCGVLRFDGPVRVHGVRLAEAAGFGTVSPVSGLLLHPEYGPWLRVRAALLCDGAPFGAIGDASISDSFQPCCGCERPCLSACPASVHDGRGYHDLLACASHRRVGGCSEGCASRAACPVGSEHRDRGGSPLHRHTHELATMERWFGLGPWRFVPKALRGGP